MIEKNNKKVVDVYKGESDVKEIYKGKDLIFSDDEVVEPEPELEG